MRDGQRARGHQGRGAEGRGAEGRGGQAKPKTGAKIDAAVSKPDRNLVDAAAQKPAPRPAAQQDFDILIVAQGGGIDREAAILAASLRRNAPGFRGRLIVAEPQPEAGLDDVIAHLEHAREVAGIDHIGLGGDYDGVDRLPRGLEDVSGYPRLLSALAERGWSAADLNKLAHGNLRRVYRAATELAGR